MELRSCKLAAALQLTVLLAFLPDQPSASSGDRAWGFQSCLQHCAATGCARLDAPAGTQAVLETCPAACRQSKRPLEGQPNNAARGTGTVGSQSLAEVSAAPVPLVLRLFRWDCADDCKYHCMTMTEARKAFLAAGPSGGSSGGTAVGIQLPVEKYYGKWPFRRVLGMQELASVLASLANLAVHAACLARLRTEALRRVGVGTGVGAVSEAAAVLTVGGAAAAVEAVAASRPRLHGPYTFLGLWTVYGCLHMNAWLWSAVFHSRDTPLTERLDYVSAISVVGFGLAAVVVRILWGRGRGRRLAALGAAATVVVGLVAHLRYMLFVKFDYSWNMRVCVAAGVGSAVLWLGWCAACRHPARQRMYRFVLLAHAAMLLELLDFPPLLAGARGGAGLLDAHAAWHVATVPLTPLFYSWLQADAAWLQGQRGEEESSKRKAT